MPSPRRPEKTEHCGVLCCGDGVYIGNSLVPVRGTNRDQRPCAAPRQKFSPTSLVERAREWFISAAAPTLSSSSQLQAFGPNLTLCCCGPIGPSAGLNPGPGWVSSRIQAVVAQ